MKLTNDALSKKLEEMLANSGKAAAARAYPMYQKLQTQRFMTENSSEGTRWHSLKPEYAEYKAKKYKGYPGGGTKLLIASSTLGGAVIGPGAPFNGTDRHVALFKNYSMQISVKMGGKNAAGKPFVYAAFVAENRPFMTFSDKSIQAMKDEIQKFIIQGK